MSETADTGDDQAWFESIEGAFIRLRGAPLLLSPADWQVARKWRREGIPLPLIVETLEKIFFQRAERGARGRVNSLRYCAPAVEAAWEERRELLSGGSARATEQALSMSERLQAIGERLPSGLHRRQELIGMIGALEGSAESIERGLAEIEATILEQVEIDLSESDRSAVTEEVDRALERLSGRLSAAERARTRKLLWRRALRRAADLPELSLFAPSQR